MVKKNQLLGRLLIKNRQKSHITTNLSERHSFDQPDNSKSITENTSLDEFLSIAEISNKQFLSERENIKLVGVQTASPVFSGDSKTEFSEQLRQKALLIPRRPKWTTAINAVELNKLENESYLEWRRNLAHIQEENSDLVMTPFEKNLQFWRQLWRVIERSDILVQILDARNPLMFYCEDLDKYIDEVDSRKKSVILLNKADYLTPTQRLHWLEYFESIGKICVFFSAIEQQPDNKTDQNGEINGLSKAIGQIDLEKNERHIPFSYCQLINYFKCLLKNDSSTTTTRMTTVGFVGYPNVGKSSTINALLRAKCVSVSAIPGKTKHFQTIILDDQLTICDCPGLVFPNIVSNKAEMIINGILPIDQMREAPSLIEAITSKIPARCFEALYGIVLRRGEDEKQDSLDEKTTALKLLTAHGYSRGFMTQRGLPDTSRSARYIIRDFVTGKILFCYAPPTIKQEDYHRFKIEQQIKTSNATSVDRKLIQAMEGQNLLAKDFDREYFQSKTISAHVKKINVGGHDGNLSSKKTEANDSKPWKKHNNRNKREKLRRVYSHLDN